MARPIRHHATLRPGQLSTMMKLPPRPPVTSGRGSTLFMPGSVSEVAERQHRRGADCMRCPLVREQVERSMPQGRSVGYVAHWARWVPTQSSASTRVGWPAAGRVRPPRGFDGSWWARRLECHRIQRASRTSTSSQGGVGVEESPCPPVRPERVQSCKKWPGQLASYRPRGRAHPGRRLGRDAVLLALPRGRPTHTRADRCIENSNIRVCLRAPVRTSKSAQTPRELARSRHVRQRHESE